MLSSFVYHRSGANIADEPRRAYMPQFSWGPIQTTTRSQNVAFAVPIREPPPP
jgi:hypothetical protein